MRRLREATVASVITANTAATATSTARARTTSKRLANPLSYRGRLLWESISAPANLHPSASRGLQGQPIGLSLPQMSLRPTGQLSPTSFCRCLPSRVWIARQAPALPADFIARCWCREIDSTDRSSDYLTVPRASGSWLFVLRIRVQLLLLAGDPGNQFF